MIREALLIGGVDWSTSGVSERGFSNALGLGYKSHRIGLSGYNYGRLYGYAEMVADKIKKNKRVSDVSIELANQGYYGRGMIMFRRCMSSMTWRKWLLII